MVRLRNASPRRGAAHPRELGALGLTIAFVALRRSKPRQGDQDGDKRKALATYLRASLGRRRYGRSKWSGSQVCYRGSPEGNLFGSCTTSFAKTEACRGNPSRARVHLAVNKTTGGSGDRECPSRRGRRRARRSVVVPGLRRSPSACRASDACGAPRRRLSGWRTRPVVGALSNWKRMRSVSGRPSSGIAARSYRVRSASDVRVHGVCRGARSSLSLRVREVHVNWFRDCSLTLVLMAMSSGITSCAP